MVTGRVSAAVMCAAIFYGGGISLAAQAAPGRPSAAVAPGTPPGGQCGADVVKRLVGVWTAEQYRMKRTSEVGVQVFGPNAVDVRDVELTIQQSGEGTLKLSTSVVDQKGKTWAPTLIEANVVVAASQSSAADGCEPAVTVTSAEEQYLDETKYRTAIAGLRVLLLTGSAANQLELRFETPKGQGSFWTTMRRQATR